MAGFSNGGGGVSKPRVAVFIDYQNVYRRIRGAFDPRDTQPTCFGQINPHRMGIKLAGPDRQLVAVRIYRGRPTAKHDPTGNAAADRQIGTWDRLPLVTTITRPLNYRDLANPREKGIDVALAVDFVMGAQRGDFEVGVLVSADNDLLPALEAIIELRGESACEVVCWVAPGKTPQVLRIPGRAMKVHGLYEADYRIFEDTTDYNIRTRRR